MVEFQANARRWREVGVAAALAAVRGEGCFPGSGGAPFGVLASGSSESRLWGAPRSDVGAASAWPWEPEKDGARKVTSRFWLDGDDACHWEAIAPRNSGESVRNWVWTTPLAISMRTARSLPLKLKFSFTEEAAPCARLAWASTKATTVSTACAARVSIDGCWAGTVARRESAVCADNDPDRSTPFAEEE